MASTDRDLMEWLRAQLDADAQMAEAAKDPDSGWWWDAPESPAEEHIRRWRPDAVLADVAAKREALDALAHWIDGPNAHPLDPRSVAVERAVRVLATAYADRPGYRKEWSST